MKTWTRILPVLKSKGLATLVTLVMLYSVSSIAAGGGAGNTGGGNTDAIQFRNLARTSLMQVIRVSKEAAIVSAANKILEKVNSDDVNVVMVPQKLYYLGGEVDALNYPEENRIEVNEDRINRKLYVERLQLSIHEFAGLAKVPDSNNVISSQLSNPAGFKMLCTVDIIGSDQKRLVHLNMVPQDINMNGRVVLTQYMAKIGDVSYMAIFDYDEYGKTKDFETDANEVPSVSTYKNLSSGWGGRTWAFFNSVKYVGDFISIECYDSSFEEFPRPGYTPDFDHLTTN